MKKLKLIILFLIFFNLNLFAASEIFLLPKDNKKVKEEIVTLIKDAKSSIKISMYNFSYKKFAKALVKASKKGTKIKVVLDKSKVKKDDKIYKLLKKNGIEVKMADKKLHTKVALFDEKKALIGSANWKKESFKDNYELIVISKDKKLISKLSKFIDKF